MRRDFIKNITVLTSGTFIAQLIPLAVSPILTRLYDPTVFGYAGVYLAIAAIVTSISTGRYELAIILPADRTQAYDVAALAWTLAAATSLICLIVTVLLDGQINALIGLPEDSWLIYLLPFSIIITSTYQISLYLSIREKKFASVSKNRILQSTSTSVLQIGWAIAGLVGNGIVSGVLFGQALSCYYLGIRSGKLSSVFAARDPARMKIAMLRHRKFPTYDVPSTLLNLGANQMPTILLGIYFSPAIAGFYYLTQRALQAPVTLLAGSILDVFRQQAAQEQNQTGSIRDLYRKVLYLLLAISTVLSSVLYFTIEDIFTFAFGDDWATAGQYAQVLVVPLALRLVSNPLSFVFYVKEKQHYNMIGMLFLFVSVVVSVTIAETALQSIQYLAISYSLTYSFYIVMSYALASK